MNANDAHKNNKTEYFVIKEHWFEWIYLMIVVAYTNFNVKWVMLNGKSKEDGGELTKESDWCDSKIVATVCFLYYINFHLNTHYVNFWMVIINNHLTWPIRLLILVVFVLLPTIPTTFIIHSDDPYERHRHPWSE